MTATPPIVATICALPMATWRSRPSGRGMFRLRQRDRLAIVFWWAQLSLMPRVSYARRRALGRMRSVPTEGSRLSPPVESTSQQCIGCATASSGPLRRVLTRCPWSAPALDRIAYSH